MFNLGSLRGRLLSASALASVLSFAPVAAMAAGLPTHGHFASGQGSINKANQSLTVRQSSTTGIVNWKNFSIGKNNNVRFDNGSGATLNRVTGGNLSTIAGSLHATGSLYLINKQGVIVSGTGRVVTGGNFVASSGDISNGAFENDRLKIHNLGGKVVNRGTITAGGTAKLAGDTVSDSGSLLASKVVLRAANKLVISGKVSAREANGAGGTVIATGKHIDVASTAHIFASGTSGGTVLIGGDVHGGAIKSDDFVSSNVRDSKTTTIAKGAQIHANASHDTGGNIVIWSDGHTSFDGTVHATGKQGGGFAEVSSHKVLGFLGKVDLRASRGATGTLLLDPENVVIENGTTTGGSFDSGTPDTFTPTADDSVLSVGDLESALESANVEVTSGSSGSQAGDITVIAPVTWSSANSLTLDAYHSIAIDAPVTVTGTGGLTLTTNDGGTGGTYSFNGGNVAFTNVASGDNTALTINSQAYTLENNVADLAAAISTNSGAGFYALANNYDASGDNGGAAYTASPIASVANPFTGVFEGLGNTISNLTIAVTAQQTSVGLFASSSGTLRDIGLVNANVSDTSTDNVGALAGASSGTILNSYSSGVVTSGGVAGGLVGQSSAGQISQSFSMSAVSGDGEVGGLIGYVTGGSVSQSYATGAVTGTSDTGGLIGENSGGSIDSSYATGSVSSTGGAEAYVGGLVGFNGSGTITASHATGSVAGTGGMLGGFAGKNAGTIAQSWATGAVTATGDETVGGFVGGNHGTISQSWASGAARTGANGLLGGFAGKNGGAIEQSYSASVLTGGTGSTIGGFVGANGFVGFNGSDVEYDGTITQSYSTGSVAGGTGSTIGGFAGTNGYSGNSGVSTIDESYSSGAVTGTSSVAGGFAGLNFGTLGGTTENFYNTTQNPSLSAVGDDSGAVAASQDGALTSAQMMVASRFTGWTFGTTGGGSGWVIVDQDGSLNNASGAAGGTTPMLLSEYSTTITSAHQLQLMELDPTANYTLANDIDAGGTAGGDVWGSQGFIAVGGNNASGSFTGTFDGASHTIANLTIDDSTNFEVGLFGESTGAIENAGLTNDNVTGGAGANVGGLVGWNNGGSVADSYAAGAVTGGLDATAGGLVGFNAGAISQSHATGTVAGDTYATVGGLVGNNVSDGTITQSYATGAVTGGGHGYVGGLLGVNAGAITQSYATGAVMGGFNADVGGFVGGNAGSGTIDESYELGAATIVSGTNVGGFAGSNGGTLGGTTAVYYNSDANSEGDASTFTKGGGLTNAQMRDPSNFSGWNFGGLGSGANWVTIGSNAAVGGTGGTTPMLLSEYSTTLTNAHQLQLMALDGTATYTVGRDFDASGTAGGDVWNSTGFIPVSYFIGTLDGAGHAISNLTINNTYYAGLFYEMGDGTVIENIGLTNVNISGSGDVGGFAGDGYGFVISNSYVTGTLSSTSGAVGGLAGYSDLSSTISSSHAEVTITKGHDVGGLVGYSGASISNSYATGSIKGGATVGGLVGTNDGGTITQSYSSATVQVSSDEYAGGLVGENYGLISQSFATGSVTGPASSALGGFVGYNHGGISQSYATGAVQGGQESEVGGFVGSNDGSIDQSYSLGTVTAPDPYVIGGFAAYDGSAGGITHSYWNTDTSGISTDGSSDNGAVGRTTQQLQSGLPTGFASSAWEIVAGTSFPYLSWQFNGTPEVVSGHALTGYGGSAVSGVAVSMLNNGVALSSALGSITTYADGYYYYLLAPNTLGTNSNVLAYRSGTGGAALATNASGSVANLDIYGHYLHEVTSDSDYSDVTASLASAVGSNSAAQTVVNGLSNLAIDASQTFEIDSAINLGSGTLVINTSGGNPVTQSAAITASSVLLEGDSSFTLDDASNSIGTLAAFGTGALTVDDHHALTVGSVAGIDGITAGGAVSLATTTGNIVITKKINTSGNALTLVSAGNISESGSGLIDALSLSGSSNSTTALNGANVITDLGTFTSGSTFELTDNHDLTVDGTVKAGAHTVELKTTGSGHDIAIDAKIEGSIVDLVSAATISENGSGDIDATKLEGSSVSTTEMNSAKNTITDLGTFTSGSTFELTDDHDLTVDGTVKASGHTVELTTKGSGHDINLDAKIEAKELKLASAATITESKAGDIDVTELTGASHSSAEMNSAENTITDLAAFTSGGAFELTDDHALKVDGIVNAGSHTLDLTTVGKNHNLAIDAKIEGGTINLSTTGEATESKAGEIEAKLLNVTAGTGIDLTSKKNKIKKLGTHKTKKGPNKVTL